MYRRLIADFRLCLFSQRNSRRSFKKVLSPQRFSVPDFDELLDCAEKEQSWAFWRTTHSFNFDRIPFCSPVLRSGLLHSELQLDEAILSQPNSSEKVTHDSASSSFMELQRLMEKS